MGARMLDGRAIADARNRATRDGVAARREAAGRAPRLDVVLAGDDAASMTYVRRKESAATKVGIDATVHRLDDSATASDIATLLARLGADEGVDGIVLQLPLPGGIDARRLFPLIAPMKDVDGLHPVNQGRLLQGDRDVMVPATPLAVHWLLQAAGVTLRGAEVVIVSHSNLIGKPLAALLVNEDATVTVCHKHTRGLAAHTRRADILVTAAGVPDLITAEHVRAGAVVIDAATVHDAAGRLVGDCAADVAAQAGTLTPVPGGVGPVTVAALLANTNTAWQRRTAQQQSQ